MLFLRSVAYGSILLAALAVGQESSTPAGSTPTSSVPEGAPFENASPNSLPERRDIPGRKSPSVTMSPAPIAVVTRGKSNTVHLRFHVSSGFHVNSNQPKSEFLIPTALKLSAPTDIVIGRVSYPPAQEMSFAFSPDEKLSVYSGEIPVVVDVRPLAGVVTAKYMVRGELKYQACDNAACYPPKKLPVQFEIQVIKGPPPHRRNPGQSPHVHL